MVGLVIAGSLGITRMTVIYLAHLQPLRLPPAELQKLATLRNTTEPRLLSAVSPDDTTIVTMALPETGRGGSEPGTPQFAFLNVQDGSSKAVDKAVLSAEPETEVAWRDDHTAVYLSATQAGDPLLVELNRDSGAVISSTVRLPGRPLSLAPNAARVLIEMAGSDGATLAAFDLASDKITPLLTYPPGGGPSDMAWTPDGSKLALVRLDLPPYLAADQQRATELAMQDALGELPPTQNPFFQGNVVDVFDLARHDFRPGALKASDGDGDLFNRIRWNTDGTTLMAQMARPARLAGRQYPIYRHPDHAYLRFYDAGLMEIGTLDRSEIEAVSSSSAIFVSPDELMIVAPDGITFRLHYYNRASGEFRTLPTDEGLFAEAPGGYQVHATHHSRQLIFNHSSFQHPPELYRIGWDGTQLQALTQLNARAAAANRIRVDRVMVPLNNGATRVGYLLQPASASFPPHNVRMVIYQQGGPGGAMTNRWGQTAEEPFTLLPNFGISVLFMPFAGREGFGPEFFTALMDERNFGQLDIDEAAQAVEFLIKEGYTARDRVGITGCSYGGYFTSQSITRHPDLYAAANTNCSMLDLAYVWEFIARPDVTYWEGRVPTTDLAEYTADSPRAQAANVRTPLLLTHGGKDTLPVSSVTDFRDQIAATGTPAELITFKDEGHGLSQPSTRMAAAQAQIRWFQTHLAAADPR
jgi:dipeptidyl aminopeptidase/acylaminoacyl peptidase